MTPLVSNTLREWKLACPTTTLNLVFPSERGEVIWHTNLYKQCFLSLLAACELMITMPAKSEGRQPQARPPYNFHALRHAAASLFIEHGWTPKKFRRLRVTPRSK
jgi:hypothetical protein